MISTFGLEKLAPHEPTSQYRHNRTARNNAGAHLKRRFLGREVVVAITNGLGVPITNSWTIRLAELPVLAYNLGNYPHQTYRRTEHQRSNSSDLEASIGRASSAEAIPDASRRALAFQ